MAASIDYNTQNMIDLAKNLMEYIEKNPNVEMLKFPLDQLMKHCVNLPKEDAIVFLFTLWMFEYSNTKIIIDEKLKPIMLATLVHYTIISWNNFNTTFNLKTSNELVYNWFLLGKKWLSSTRINQLSKLKQSTTIMRRMYIENYLIRERLVIQSQLDSINQVVANFPNVKNSTCQIMNPEHLKYNNNNVISLLLTNEYLRTICDPSYKSRALDKLFEEINIHEIPNMKYIGNVSHAIKSIIMLLGIWDIDQNKVVGAKSDAAALFDILNY